MSGAYLALRTVIAIFLAAAVVAVLVFATLIPILKLKKGESTRED